MRLEVTYEDGEPTEISHYNPDYHGFAFFEMEGTTAVFDGTVHGVDRDAVAEAVAELPFVQAVDMDSYEEKIREQAEVSNRE